MGGRLARPARPATPRRIGVSKVSAIADAQVLYSSPLDIEASGEAPGFDALVRSAWRDRGFGDFWGYALVAEGAAEAMIEVGPNSWDLAAPSIVVEEAGGRMTDIRGVRSIHTGTALATNGLLHDHVIRGPRGVVRQVVLGASVGGSGRPRPRARAPGRGARYPRSTIAAITTQTTA